MAYPVIDKNSKSEDWRGVLAERGLPSLEMPWSWCPGSYTHEGGADGSCPYCKQSVGITWRGKGELYAHLNMPIGAGVYLFDVGRTDRAPDAGRCFKFGCSTKVVRRLTDHFSDSKHERCVVLHCLPCPPGWQICMTIECLLSELLKRKGAAGSGKPSGQTFEYFKWNEDLISSVRRFLIPDLVTDIMKTFEHYSRIGNSKEG